MSLKNLFINSDENPNEEKKPVVTTQKQSGSTQFPKSESDVREINNSLFSSFSMNFGNKTPEVKPIVSGSFSQEHFQKALEIYQNGFDSLNQSGYDFYEFYQAVKQTGIDNPQIYVMAFTMGQTMDKSITKDKLYQQANFYIDEINKVHNDYVMKGSEKKAQITTQRTSESQNLTNELAMMEQQMEALKVQIQDRRNKLNLVDSKYNPQISEIESKLSANDSAKNEVINSIKTVQNGLLTHLN
jgi:hypothetical protein